MDRLFDRCTGAIIGALALALIALAAGMVDAGPLDPDAAPGPTMRTLAELPPAWDRTLSSSGGGPAGCDSARFSCVFDTRAALDRETGLVWRVNMNDFLAPDTIAAAQQKCAGASVSGRHGWRLPTVAELTSLFDDPTDTSAGLPAGHPFTFVQTGFYWTQTLVLVSAGSYFGVNFETGATDIKAPTEAGNILCVRAPG